MLLHQGPSAGTTLSGELQSGDGRASLAIIFRVAHMVQLRTGDYLLGGPFLHPLTPEEMQPFLGGPFLHPLTPEEMQPFLG